MCHFHGRTIRRAATVAVAAVTALASAVTPTAAVDPAEGWDGYRADTDAASAALATAPSLAASIAALTHATADDATRGYGPENGDPSYTCYGVARLPGGRYEPATNYLYAHAKGDVYCDFVTRAIAVTVEFAGYDPSRPGGFSRTGSTFYCYDASSCEDAIVFYEAYSCTGRYDHYARVHASYQDRGGRWTPITNNGVSGPHNTGRTLSKYC